MSGGRAAAGLCAVAFVVGSLLSLRLGRGGWRVVYVRRCGSGAAICPRFTSSVAAWTRRLALGSHPVVRFWCGVRRAIHIRRCGLDAAVGLDSHPALQLLSRRFAFGARPALRFWCGVRRAVHVRRCGSVVAICPRFTPAVCLSTNRTACDILRSCSAGSRSPFVRSRGVGAVICLCGFTSGLYVSLWRSRRGTEDAGDGERRTGLAARPLYAFAQAHWLCSAFRGEYVGATRPKPAPKSRMWKRHCRLSGLSSRCGGAALVRIRAVTRVHGKTRPTLIYGRAGRAV